ncbi:glycosyltransferase family 4 protein [Bryocella elongata]|uniref:glycosyltransferase family 4 protein n=1 Tax=Bryocella elongata TaxID=863522 RepID=UPI001F280DB6|nr:glycosyltransferase family 4 protein [Bryocella elongata]
MGRIERRKCQLELVQAVKGTHLKLVLIGKPGPNNLAYFEQIKREMGDNVTIIDHIDQTELPRYYASCKVHALVSWMETAGLSTLEAGNMGANVVITNRGDTQDTFVDLAYYCEPDSVESVRAALLAAHNAPSTPFLRERILANYTWDRAAAATLAAYREILSLADSHRSAPGATST